MYELNTQVRFSMCDRRQQLSIGGIIDCLQDVCNMQSYKNGVGSDYMTAGGTAWILNSWNVRINRRPQIYETLKVFTWPYEFKGFFGMRNFKIEDEQGEVVAHADSMWTLIDIHTGRPTKISGEVISHYQVEDPYPMEHVGRKLSVPEEAEFAGMVEVKAHHLDLNNHMNNAQYVREAADCLPDGFEAEGILVEYRRQTRLAEKMEFHKTMEENCVTIVMKDSEGAVHAIVKFDGKFPEVGRND